MLTASGFSLTEIDLLDVRPETLTQEQIAVVNAEREAVADHFNVHPMLRSGISVGPPATVGDIVSEYGGVLEAVSSSGEFPAGIYPESKLPFSRAVIEEAFASALEHVTDPVLLDQLKVGMMYLEDFVPDEQLADHPQVRARVAMEELGVSLGMSLEDLRNPRATNRSGS